MPVYTDLLPETKSETHGAFTWAPEGANATSHVAGVLTLTGKRSHCRYRVEEFPADMGRGFMLFKLDAGSDKSEERYACFTPTSRNVAAQCECKGFAFGRGKPCKHLAAVLGALGNGWL